MVSSLSFGRCRVQIRTPPIVRFFRGFLKFVRASFSKLGHSRFLKNGFKFTILPSEAL